MVRKRITTNTTIKKERKGKQMKTITNTITKRISPSASLKQSLTEVALIRQGKLPKKTWRELRAELKK